MIIGAILLAINMAFVTLFCGLFAETNLLVYGIVAYVFLTTFGIVFSFSYTPLQSLYCVEILEFKARATGMAFEQLVVNGLAYLQNFILANGANQLGYKFFSTFFVVDILGAWTFYRYFPETRGLSLEEIKGLYCDDRGPVAASLEILNGSDQSDP